MPQGLGSCLLAYLGPPDIAALAAAGTATRSLAAPDGSLLLAPALEVDLRRWPFALARIEAAQVEELSLYWADDQDSFQVASGLFVMGWLSSFLSAEKNRSRLRKLHLGAQDLSRRFPEAIGGFLASLKQTRLEELSTGLLTPSLLPLLGGFRHLHSLCMPVECRGPDSYVTAWEAVAKCPSLRNLSLFAQGKAMKVEGEKLERISMAVQSLELESLQINVSALQGGLGQLRWPKRLRSLRVLGEDFCRGAADLCSGSFAERLCETAIEDLHLDSWRGLSSRSFRRLLAAMAGSQLERLQISWLRSPGRQIFAMLAGFIEAAVCLRQMVLDIPLGQEWSVDPEAFHLEEVALRRDVSILWRGGGPLVQDLEVEIVVL